MTIAGIGFPFNKGSVSFPVRTTDEQVISDNIKRILYTPRRSRVMRPGVGSDTFHFAFESIGPVLNARVISEVRRAIASGEPRAKVLNVSVVEQRKTNGDRNVLVTVDYEVNLRPGSASVLF